MPLRPLVLAGLAVALVLAILVSPFASAEPDGLERVADDQGFLDRGTPAPPQESSPIPDYAFPGIGSEGLSTAAAGLAGTLVVFVLAYGLALLLRGGRGRGTAGTPEGPAPG